MVERPVRDRRRLSQSAGVETGGPENEREPDAGNTSNGPSPDAAANPLGQANGAEASDPEGQFSEPLFATPTQTEVYQAVLSEFMPIGIVEETWCRDIARNVHHAHRLRLLRDGYLRAAGTKVLHEAVRGSLTYAAVVGMGNELNQYVANTVGLLKLGRKAAVQGGYQQNYDDAVRQVRTVGFDPSDVDSRAYVDNMSKLEALEKLIVVTDSRRDLLIRELERRRATDAMSLMPSALRHVRRG